MKNIIRLYRIYCKNRLQKLDADNTALLFKFNKTRRGGPRTYFCQAPFNALMFDLRGEVKPCWNCHSAYENYPEKTLQQIWQGPVFEKMRQHFSKNEIPEACDFCKSALAFGNFDTFPALKFDDFPVNKNGFPSYMEFVAGNTCNLECVMCNGECSSAIRANREKRPPASQKYDASFVGQLKPFIPHLKAANFVGGEPFLMPLYYQIWDLFAALNPGISVHITSNGTVLNDRVRNTLEKGRFSISISLDALSKGVFESVRKNAALEVVLKNIEWFSTYTKRKGTGFNINMCIIRETWQELPEIIKFCNARGATIFFCDVLQPLQNAVWTLEAPAIKKIMEFLTSCHLPEQTTNEKYNKAQLTLYLQKLDTWHQMALKRENLRYTRRGMDPDVVVDRLKAYLLFEEASDIQNDFHNKYLSNMRALVQAAGADFFTPELFEKMDTFPAPLVRDILADEQTDAALRALTMLRYFCETAPVRES